MRNFDAFKKEISEACEIFKGSFSCQLYRIRSGNLPCKKGLFGRGCKKCKADTLEWLFEESDGIYMRNCEMYADEIEEAVANATYKGLNSKCAMYKYRTDGEVEFIGSFSDIVKSIQCDEDCTKCSEDTYRWMMSNVDRSSWQYYCSLNAWR